MGLSVKNMECVVMRTPEIVTGVANDREWVKAEIVVEVRGNNGVAHDLHVVAWNAKARQVEGMLLKRGSIILLDLTVKSKKYKEWWRTDVVVDDISYVKQERSDIGVPIVHDEVMFVQESDGDLPF